MLALVVPAAVVMLKFDRYNSRFMFVISLIGFYGSHKEIKKVVFAICFGKADQEKKIKLYTSLNMSQGILVVSTVLLFIERQNTVLEKFSSGPGVRKKKLFALLIIHYNR